LLAHGVLPKRQKYAGGLKLFLVWLSDGMPWFEDDILPQFLTIVVILDAYHVMDRL